MVITTCLIALLAAQCGVWQISVPTMPVSPFADTEVSTNVPINRTDINYADLEFSFAGTPTNNLELAFGTDVNANGVLEADEVETRFGWRSGRYFIENAVTWERFESAQTQGTQSLSVKMHLDVRWSPQQVKTTTVTGSNASVFGDLAVERPPEWLWRREWNLMRATRRGSEPPSDWVDFNGGRCGFSLRLR